MERLKGEFKIVPLGQVQPNTWNPKDNPEMNPVEYGNVLKSISAYGLRQAIVVREIGPDKYEIIDGAHRWLACKELGYKNVIINNQGQVSDQEAKKLTINFQDVRVPFNQLELAGLIKELSETEENLHSILPYNEEEIEEYKKLLEFSWDDYVDFLIEFEQSKPVLTFRATSEQIEEIKTIVNKNVGEITGNVKMIDKIVIQSSQRELLKQALEKVMEKEGVSNKGKALEIICKNYLESNNK